MTDLLADPEPTAAVRARLDLLQRQARNVDERLRRLDLKLHQVQKIGAPGDEPRAGHRGCQRGGDGFGFPDVVEVPHDSTFAAASRIASTMLG